MARRGFSLDQQSFLELDARRKELQTSTQDLQNQRNRRSKAIGQAKAKGEDIQPLLDEVAVGDYVLIHVGYALNKVSEDEALQTLELFAQAGLIGDGA